MFKKFKESDEAVVSVTPHVHLWNLAPDMIKTVHFGYQYDADEMTADIASLLASGSHPTFYRLVVDRDLGALREEIVK
jgi:hypothetical protein